MPPAIPVAALLLVLAAVFLLGLRQIHSPDLGFHLRSGEWILENSRVPGGEVFGYTAAAARYIDLYWLYQVLQEMLRRLGGPGLLIIVNAGLIVVAVGLTALRAIGRSPEAMFAVPLVLLLGVVGFTYDTRPHVVSWVFLSIVLLLLERHARKESAPLWVIPVVMVAWVNMHPLAVLGLVAIGVFLAGGFLEQRQIDRALLRIAGFSAAAFVATPYLFDGLAVPLQQFGFLQADSAFKAAIAEYVDPFSIAAYRHGGRPFYLHSMFPLHVYTALAVGVGALCVRRRAWSDLLLMAAFFFVFSLAVKNFEYFFLATLPVTVLHLQRRVRSGVTGPRRSRRAGDAGVVEPLIRNSRVRLAITGVAAVLAVATQCVTATDAWYVYWKAPFRTGLSIDPLHVPYRAAAFMNEHNLRGRILNDISSGGWLLWYWKGQVFIDGRNEVYDERLLRSVLRTLSDPRALGTIIDEHAPHMAVFNYMKNPQWLAYFAGRKDWRLAYADDLSAVWLRNGYADEVPAATMPAGFRTLPDAPPLTETIRKDYPSGVRAFFASLGSRQYYPWSEYQESMLAYQMGWLVPAERLALEGLRRATVPSPPLLFNLGSVLDELGNSEGARAAYARFLEFDDDPVARRRLSALGPP
jgi:hypothetical protein